MYNCYSRTSFLHHKARNKKASYLHVTMGQQWPSHHSIHPGCVEVVLCNWLCKIPWMFYFSTFCAWQICSLPLQWELRGELKIWTAHLGTRGSRSLRTLAKPWGLARQGCRNWGKFAVCKSCHYMQPCSSWPSWQQWSDICLRAPEKQFGILAGAHFYVSFMRYIHTEIPTHSCHLHQSTVPLS